MDIGSLSGAIWSTVILSPGTQPISMSFRNISSFSKDSITTVRPTFISDSFFRILFGGWFNDKGIFNLTYLISI